MDLHMDFGGRVSGDLETSEVPQQIQPLEARAKPNGKSFFLQTRIQLDESETSSRALVGGD
jgi:hypothetical protein